MEIAFIGIIKTGKRFIIIDKTGWVRYFRII